MPQAAPVLMAAGATAAGTAAIYTAVKTAEAQKAAEKREREYLEFQERQAGEYVQLTESQMTLQSQMQNIKTLADMIEKKKQQSVQVLTLPKAKTYTPVQQINLAIERLFKG